MEIKNILFWSGFWILTIKIEAWNPFRNPFRPLFYPRKQSDLIVPSPLPLPIPEKEPEKWYIIGKNQEFETNKPYPILLQEKKYVVWRDEKEKYYALENKCSHKAARLSDGFIDQGCIVCPYHFTYFNEEGKLLIGNLREKDQMREPPISISMFQVLKNADWIYLNPDSNQTDARKPNIYNLVDTVSPNEREIEIETNYECNAECIAEKLLDIIHYYQPPNPGPNDVILLQNPHWISKNNLSNHAQAIYQFKTGIRSITNNNIWFLSNKVRDNYFVVESEFILPYTFITRIQCGGYVLRYVSSISPISQNKCRIYTKVYRNFFKNLIGDIMVHNFIHQFLEQDREILENIDTDIFLMTPNKNQRYYHKQEKMIRFYRKNVPH
jgi:phenylpropionate dioxygenase-like ring-hydroxylating dioxygenase large terminal subunit